MREFLGARVARERSPAERSRLHAAVADALEAQDRGSEAIEHWLAAGCFERAGEQVARHAEALLVTAPATVEGWLRQLPGGARAAPGLRLLEGRLASGTGRLEDADASLREAVAGYAASGDEEQAWVARSFLIDSYLICKRFDAAIPLADGHASSSARAAPVVALSAAAALAGVGRYREASELFSEVSTRRAGSALASLATGFHGFFVDLPRGRLGSALVSVSETVAQLERADPFGRLPYLLGFAAVIHDERGEPEESAKSFARAERAAERTVLQGYVGDLGHRFAASAHARAGRLDDAERALGRVTGRGLMWFTGDVEVTRTMLAARRGAYAAVDEAVDRALGGELEPWPARFRTITLLVPVLIEAGRRARARELVDETLAVRPALASCARLLALRGWLRNLDGDRTGALADALLAWEEAGDGVAYLVRRERPRLEPLLWTALEQGALTPETVLAALEAAVPGGAAVLPFTRHAVPAVRRAAVLAAAASGHPQATAGVDRLEADPDPGVAGAARAARDGLAVRPPPLVFTLLGGFALQRGAFRVDDAAWHRRAAQRLVRFLLVHRDAAVSEDALFAVLWPDKPPDTARRNLQVIVSAARVVLDGPATECSVLLVTQRSYRLALSQRDVVDADEFERAAEVALRASGPRRAERLEAAASRWTGEPLPEDRYEDWATAHRERLIDLWRDGGAGQAARPGDTVGRPDQ